MVLVGAKGGGRRLLTRESRPVSVPVSHLHMDIIVTLCTTPGYEDERN